MTKKLAPMHPGEVLREEFLVPLRLSAGALARKMDVPRTRVERIAEETTGITALIVGRAKMGRLTMSTQVQLQWCQG